MSLEELRGMKSHRRPVPKLIIDTDVLASIDHSSRLTGTIEDGLLTFEVLFGDGAIGLHLADQISGGKGCYVQRFTRSENGAMLPAELTGRINRG